MEICENMIYQIETNTARVFSIPVKETKKMGVVN